MRPVRHNLKAIREKPDTDNKEKLSEYGRALIINIKTVGDHIEQQTRNFSPVTREKKRKHLWYLFLLFRRLIRRCFVRNFWPLRISHKRLQGMYDNVVAREKERAAAKAAKENGL